MVETNIIVGAGQAGAWATLAMREAGFAGRILLIGEEEHRPYERPPLSKQVLVAADEPDVLYFHEERRYTEHAIETRFGARVMAVDPAERWIELPQGERLGFDRLLFATGGRARQLDIPGGEQIRYLRTLDEARQLRRALSGCRNVVCIGAGVIGLEIASSARARGAAVTVLEAADRAMLRALSPEGSQYIEDLHRGAGVELCFGVNVEAVEPDRAGGFRVQTSAGAFLTDCVVAGIGMTRNDEIAAAAGIAVDNGILVDEHGRTSTEGIFAAGDVAAFTHPLFKRRLRLESWRHAQDHGIAVGKTMAGVETVYDAVPWFWTDQHGVNLQVCGFPSDGVQCIRRPGKEPQAFALFHVDAEGICVGVTAVDSPREARAGQSLIAARRPVDASALADPAVPLQRIVKAAR